MQIEKYIDHTLLKPTATSSEIDELIEQAKKYKFKSICVNPFWVKYSAEKLKGTGVEVCTVIGFPLGANTQTTKLFETQQATRDGADEIDMVINIGKAKAHDWEYIHNEIFEIKNMCGKKLLKVIFETSYFNNEEIKKLVEISVEAHADFVKTSTGFSSAGATVEHVKLMYETGKGKIQVKASGGVRTRADFDAMVKAGATRIGTSGGIAIIENKQGTNSY